MSLSRARREQLAAYLEQQLPDRPGLRVRELKPLGTGWETDMYSATVEFETENGAADQPLVLRQYHGPQHQVRAAREFKLLQRLRRLGLPVPEVIQPAGQRSPHDSSFVVMEHIAGPTMRGALESKSDQQIIQQLERMARLLVEIHRTAWRQALPETEPRSPESQLAQLRETVERLGLAEFEPHLNWLEQRRQPGGAEEPVLLHNDYHPENILLRGRELVVIDWSFASAGDFRMDLAWTLLLVGTMLGERFRESMLRTYERHRGVQVTEFEYFEALKLATRVLTLLTWLDGSVEIPVHRITRDAMRGEYRIHVLNPYHRLKQITGLELPTIEGL